MAWFGYNRIKVVEARNQLKDTGSCTKSMGAQRSSQSRGVYYLWKNKKRMNDEKQTAWCSGQNIMETTDSSLPQLSEISGAMHLALPGLTAGRQTKCRSILKFLNSLYIETFDFSLRLTKVQHHYNSTNAFQVGFSGKTIDNIYLRTRRYILSMVKRIARPFLRCENPQNHMISYQPLIQYYHTV